MNRAGREDDFTAAEILLAAIDHRLDADALRAFEQQLLTCVLVDMVRLAR
jgi:hypothetical protein